jgi:hypothetical protein
MHFVEIVDSEVRLPHRRREVDSVPRQERRIHIGPGSCSGKKARCSVCCRRRGPRDTAVDPGLRNEQGLSSDMMLADQWRADAIMCVQPL